MRRASLLLAAAAVIVPFTWAYLATAALYHRAAADGGQEGAYVCGLPALANFLLAAFGCVLASVVALLLGAIAYRRLPAPRPRRRLAELGALALPLVLVGGYVVTLFLPTP